MTNSLPRTHERRNPNACVYKIEAPSGGFYIGSSVNVKRRFLQHKRALLSGNHTNEILQRAADKYGVESLVFTCVATSLDEKHIRDIEQAVIDDLKPSYNISKNAYSAIFDDEVVKKRLRALSKPIIRLTDGAVFESGYEAARQMNGDNQRDNLPTALKNGWRWLGHFWKYAVDAKTLEEAEASSRAGDAKRKRNAATGVASARSRPVVCLDTGVLYPSCKAAEVATGVFTGGVSHSAITRTRAGGFFWRFADEAVSLDDANADYLLRVRNAKEARANSLRRMLSKRVRCIETGEVFDSVSLALKSKPIGKDSIRLSIINGRKVSGFSWEYVNA